MILGNQGLLCIILELLISGISTNL